MATILRGFLTTVFAKAAREAYKLCVNDAQLNPVEAWKEAIAQFSQSSNVREKVCPRNTFLGLCAEGLLKGISKDRCATDSVERQYARQAVDWLREHPDTATTPSQLWDKIGNAHIRYDRQMHIVLALWCAGLIEDGGK